MSQATDWSVPLSGPATPNDMADRMDKSLDALLSSHSGASRPAYAVAGTVWLSTAVAGEHQYYHYDGTADRLLYTVDTATGALVFADDAATIHAATAKTLLSGTEEFGLWDSTLKKILFSDFVWQCRCDVGGYYYVDTSKAGAVAPPSTTTGPVFIELTAGLTGVGAFNNGKLTSESVSGSAPLVLATAVISVTGSPMNGQTVDLINTEGRILRPSTSPGTKQNDAFQNTTGTIDIFGSTASGTDAFSAAGISGTRPSAGANGGVRVTFDASNSPGARASTETRMKNVGVKAYMRVK